MRLIQFLDRAGARRVGITSGSDAIDVLSGEQTVYGLARVAISNGSKLHQLVQSSTRGEPASYDELVAMGRILSPMDHPDPAHLLVSGTGLTHLGSADARDRMHKMEPSELTDSMRMFRLGLEGGKPAPGAEGVQPEWFYKGDGSWVAQPYGDLSSPPFALGDGEEPEVAGIYLIGPNGVPYRVGYALGNEFSDHVVERQNYLYLAHSKLRPCSFGPELLLEELPQDLRGSSRIYRDGQVIWEKPFLSGEANMSHSIANLEHHHFKYARFRRPGDVHVHFFGTATLSFADGVALRPGDEIEIESAAFGRPLRNRLVAARAEDSSVRAL